MIRKDIATSNVINSATTIAHQIPFGPSIFGKRRSAMTWKRVRSTEMIAEIMPLFRAVKKAETHMFNPMIRNANR